MEITMYQTVCPFQGTAEKTGKFENRGQQEKGKKDYSYVTYICVIWKKY